MVVVDCVCHVEIVSQWDIISFIGCLPGMVAASHTTVRYMGSMVFVSSLVSLFVVTVDLVRSALALGFILAVVACSPVLVVVVVVSSHMFGMAVVSSVLEGVAAVYTFKMMLYAPTILGYVRRPFFLVHFVLIPRRVDFKKAVLGLLMVVMMLFLGMALCLY